MQLLTSHSHIDTSYGSDLVQSVISAHGGLSTYKNLTHITTTFHFTGLTLTLKGHPQHLNPTATISTTAQKVIYRGLGGPADEEWIFTPSRVWKQRLSPTKEITIIESRDNPREAFTGLEMEDKWDDLQFVYFCGYALWQYFNFPYFLTQDAISSIELPPHQESGHTWRVLEVTFPPQSVFASHNKIQRYYFDEKFQLRRHDYAPDVLGGAAAAHYCFDEVVVGGMTFAGMRRVVAVGEGEVPMLYGPVPTLINLLFTKIELKGEGNAANDTTWALTEAPVVS
jgi:hypothetical protein